MAKKLGLGNVKVKLDGKYVWANRVDISINKRNHHTINRPDIRLELANGDVIYDDGTRVEVIMEI